METFLVEHYGPDVTVVGFGHAAKRVRIAADAMAQVNVPIAFLHSTLVPEDETAFCVFSAESRSLVERAYRLAGVTYERIVAAIPLVK